MEAGIAYWFIAIYKKDHGQDPSSSFQNSIKQYQIRLKEPPDDPYSLYNLGMVYSDQGSYEVSSGKDPTLSFRKALEVHAEGIEIHSK